jgi:type IV pilus assembly protein PilY1
MKTHHRFGFVIAALALLGTALNAAAQVTDLANTPLVTAAPNAVKPNIMFILDDSGSMARDYMPDDVADFASGTYSRYAAQCNGLAYNPNTKYKVPVASTGADMPLGAFTFPTDGTPIFYYTYSGSQPALGYTYDSSGVITSTLFYRECNSVVGSAPGNGLFTRVTVTALSTDIQNYRNWYTYYRTRMLMTRSAASLAFQGIGDRYRVGFSTITTTTVDGTKFLDTSDFDATQKATWYTRLFGSDPDASTPLRGALSKAGQYYAKSGRLASGGAQTYDPVQFSCQKNFAILTTDGYWNTGRESSTYGPFRLDGSNVGQQDGAAPRPMRDGGVETYTVTTPMQQLMHWRRTRAQTQTTTERYTAYRSVNCGGGRRQLQYQTVARSRTATNTETSYYQSTRTYNSVVTYTGGTASAPVVQNVSNGPYSSEGTTVTSGFTGGTWSAFAATTAWTNQGSCSGGVTVPPNSAVTATTGPASAWGSYSGYAVTTPTETATATGPAVEGTHTTSGGSSDSLADVAMYYYETDLRTPALGNCTLSNGTNVCTNNVAARGDDKATHQHMTTFTVGLGVNGTLGYDPSYLSGGSPDFQALVAGTKDWPNPADGNGAENIDDLWHAAVNGRGQYFSAKDPATLASSLSGTLAAIDARSGTASAAATSSLQPTAGDNTEYVTSYTTVAWTGNVVAYEIDTTTGARSSAEKWSAASLLDARVAAGTARNVFYGKRSAGLNTGVLRAFTYANLQADGLNIHFDNACSKSPALEQCAQGGFDVNGANSGANMIAYLRGQADARYRARNTLLGDVVGGAPVYVRKPPFKYTENGYQAFASGSTRRGVVYVPSNDGMLHAFDGETGQEKWAYVPSMVMDRMYRLADIGYATKHEYLVNASPVVNDIYVAGTGWKSILVGGLGAGGRGYYALDITDPESPQLLWEFTNDSLGGNSNLGLTFGNPVVTKRTSGQWVVAFASGYNNVSPGDGNGRLFVVDANTGQRVTEVPTNTASGAPAGTTTTPNGLAKISNWVDSPLDNTALRFYGGDLLGNLWRFDIDGQVAPNNAALRLAELRAGSVAQPITARPELATVTQGGVHYPVVYVATGKMLGLSDLSSTGQQTIYAIKDPMTNTPLGDVHARSDMVVQTLAESGASDRSRTITDNAVDWTTSIGWRIDLLSSGERVNIDMRIALDTLVVASNVPLNDACSAGGTSYVYQFNFTTGSREPGTQPGVWLGNSFVVGVGVIKADNDNTIIRLQLGSGEVRLEAGDSGTAASVQGRRTSWRELVN